MSDDPVLAAIARLEIAFNASLGDVRGDLTGIRADQTSMRADLADFRTGLTDFRADLTDFRADMTGMRVDMGRLEVAVETSLRDVRADMTQMRAAIMDRIDRLQNRMTEIRDDLGVAMGSAEAMHRANDNTRELVRLQGEQLSIMFRQIKRLEEKVRTITGDP
jgi:chromosome segregation ATPase